MVGCHCGSQCKDKYVCLRFVIYSFTHAVSLFLGTVEKQEEEKKKGLHCGAQKGSRRGQSPSGRHGSGGLLCGLTGVEFEGAGRMML